jgi:hypothetical protein
MFKNNALNLLTKGREADLMLWMSLLRWFFVHNPQTKTHLNYNKYSTWNHGGVIEKYAHAKANLFMRSVLRDAGIL